MQASKAKPSPPNSSLPDASPRQRQQQQQPPQQPPQQPSTHPSSSPPPSLSSSTTATLAVDPAVVNGSGSGYGASTRTNGAVVTEKASPAASIASDTAAAAATATATATTPAPPLSYKMAVFQSNVKKQAQAQQAQAQHAQQTQPATTQQQQQRQQQPQPQTPQPPLPPPQAPVQPHPQVHTHNSQGQKLQPSQQPSKHPPQKQHQQHTPNANPPPPTQKQHTPNPQHLNQPHNNPKSQHIPQQKHQFDPNQNGLPTQVTLQFGDFQPSNTDLAPIQNITQDISQQKASQPHQQQQQQQHKPKNPWGNNVYPGATPGLPAQPQPQPQPQHRKTANAYQQQQQQQQQLQQDPYAQPSYQHYDSQQQQRLSQQQRHRMATPDMNQKLTHNIQQSQQPLPQLASTGQQNQQNHPGSAIAPLGVPQQQQQLQGPNNPKQQKMATYGQQKPYPSPPPPPPQQQQQLPPYYLMSGPGAPPPPPSSTYGAPTGSAPHSQLPNKQQPQMSKQQHQQHQQQQRQQVPPQQQQQPQQPQQHTAPGSAPTGGSQGPPLPGNTMPSAQPSAQKQPGSLPGPNNGSSPASTGPHAQPIQRYPNHQPPQKGYRHPPRNQNQDPANPLSQYPFQPPPYQYSPQTMQQAYPQQQPQPMYGQASINPHLSFPLSHYGIPGGMSAIPQSITGPHGLMPFPPHQQQHPSQQPSKPSSQMLQQPQSQPPPGGVGIGGPQSQPTGPPGQPQQRSSHFQPKRERKPLVILDPETNEEVDLNKEMQKELDKAKSEKAKNQKEREKEKEDKGSTSISASTDPKSDSLLENRPSDPPFQESRSLTTSTTTSVKDTASQNPHSDNDDKDRIENESRNAKEKAELDEEAQDELRAEQERLEKETAEKLQLENEQIEKQRLEAERIENERREKENERIEAERLEKERLEREAQALLEQERIEKELLEKERLEKELLEKERLEKEENDRLEKECIEKERIEKERIEKERIEKERIEKERIEKERIEKERIEKERIEKERIEKERIEAEDLERKVKAELDEKERKTKAELDDEERTEKEKQDSADTDTVSSDLVADDDKANSPPKMKFEPGQRKVYPFDFLQEIRKFCNETHAPCAEMLDIINGGQTKSAKGSALSQNWQQGDQRNPRQNNAFSGFPGGNFPINTSGQNRGTNNQFDIGAARRSNVPPPFIPVKSGSNLPKSGGSQIFDPRGSKLLSSTPSLPPVQLKQSENAWSRSKKDDDEISLKIKLVRSILNKLTPEKFDKLYKQILEVEVSNPDILTGIVKEIFEKAVMEANYAFMYADLCSKLSEDTDKILNEERTEGKKSATTFRKILLRNCQTEFERVSTEDAEAAKEKEKEKESQAAAQETSEPILDNSEEHLRAMKAKRRMLGNIRFIGELYKKKLIKQVIIKSECIERLLNLAKEKKEEDVIECLCKLIATTGQQLHESKTDLTPYFNELNTLSEDKALPSRMRFMIKDLIDLKNNNWVLRREEVKVKKISEIHADIETETKAKAAAATADLTRMNRSRTQDRRVPSATNLPRMTMHIPSSKESTTNRADQGWQQKIIRRTTGQDLKDGGSSTLQNVRLGPGGRMGTTTWIKGSSSSIASNASTSGLLQPKNVFSALEDNEDVSTDKADDSSTQAEETPLDKEQLERKIKSLLDEYVVSSGMEDAVDTLKEIPSSQREQFVSGSIRTALDNKEIYREKLPELFAEYRKNELIEPKAFFDGLTSVLVDLDDVEVDLPKASLVLGRLAGDMTVAHCFAEKDDPSGGLAPVYAACSGLDDKMKIVKLMLSSLGQVYTKNQDTAQVISIYNASDAGLLALAAEAGGPKYLSKIDDLVKGHNLEFLFSLLNKRDNLIAKIGECPPVDALTGWLKENASEEDNISSAFVESATLFGLEGAMNTSKAAKGVASDIIKKELSLVSTLAESIRTFGGDSKELGCIRGVEAFCVANSFTMDSTLIPKILNVFYEKEAFQKDCVNSWKDSKLTNDRIMEGAESWVNER